MILLLAALPSLFWDAGPGTAAHLRESGVTHILVPAAQADAWKSMEGLKVETGDPSTAIKALAPGVDYRANQASATRDPWLDANGWRFLRQPHGRFYYDVPCPRAALAAAEASCYGVDAIVHTDGEGVQPFARMVTQLSALGPDVYRVP